MLKINVMSIKGSQRDKCADASTVFQNNGVTVIALADGAGSYSMSHIGASVAVKVLSEYLTEYFEKIYNCENDMKSQFFITEAIKYEIEKKYDRDDFINFATTLLCVAVKDERFIALNLGDGIIFTEKNDGSQSVLSMPMRGLTKNQTFLLGMEDDYRYIRLRKGKLSDISSFVMYTDSLGYAFLERFMKKEKIDVARLLSQDCTDYLSEVYSGEDDYSFSVLSKAV